MSNLLEHLEALTDSRHAKGKRHSQTATLAIVLLGMLCGHVHIKARFAKQYQPQLALALPLPI
ncbi:MAG: transposase family protein [Thiotrichaceae bacterium]|nr:transposase family protein [Thiotrichaceae bacterium]MDD2814999.1 transposase family protein [Thiotrichaceae bacterium]